MEVILRVPETWWHFIPPAAPHERGLWEAGIRSVKFHLTRVVGTQSLTLEEFNTLFCQVKAALNSRPLTALTNQPEDWRVLIPGHFLIGRPLVALPEASVEHVKANRLSRWKRREKMFQHFWARWHLEYFHTLQQRNKWTSQHANIKIGDLVTIKEPNLPPLRWKLGSVIEVFPGKDKLIRIVKVNTLSGVVLRPITKL